MERIILLSSFLFFFLFLQKDKEVNPKIEMATQRSILLKLKDNSSIADILGHRIFEKEALVFQSRKLSLSLNLWSIQFWGSESEYQRVYKTIANHWATAILQNDIKIAYRALPNDSLFQQQWQYQNNGRSNGLLDADIDATEAWEITKGGKTIGGDDIVVAVLDNGINLQHPDFEDNIWINPHEIPNNGIDDDENGYIDDIHGWNVKKANNDVSNNGLGGYHGTPVAGIIGAKGGNGIGVTGVNWDVKVLNVVLSSKDTLGNIYLSAILEAYAYVYELRKKYNQTNGVEGAFIVATNASWGDDFGKVEDAPLWCEMYNIMGAEGILNVAATANADIDVEEEGDLPSLCPSDYMIAVTNTNNQDVKDYGAAYGAKSIDLAAPGQAPYTLSNTGTYSYFGGTSAACPHVAGAVALLYSMPVSELMDDIRQNPAKTAALMKAFIFAGVDKLDALKDITVSGGRLNLYKSMLELQKYYDKERTEAWIKEGQELKILQLYPQPASDWLRLTYELLEDAQIHLAIYAMNGQLLTKINLGEKENGHYEKEIDTSNLQNGCYLLVIRQNNQPVKAEQIIIMKD